MTTIWKEVEPWRRNFVLQSFDIYIYMHYIHPELRIYNFPFQVLEGSRAVLMGAVREQRGSIREQEGAKSEQKRVRRSQKRVKCQKRAML